MDTPVGRVSLPGPEGRVESDVHRRKWLEEGACLVNV